MRKTIMSIVFLLLVSTALLMATGQTEEQKVIVYTPHGEEMLTELADQFEDETGITVEFLIAGGGELVDRIRAERANPQADVLYGNPSSVFSELAADGLLQQYEPSWAGDIDPLFKDSDDYWFGTIQTPVVLFYNEQMLTPTEAPRDWLDLADSAYDDMIIFRSTTSAASRAWHASMMEQFDKRGVLESDGWDFFAALDANVKRYVSNSSLMFQAIGRQEAAIGFWTLSGVIQNRDDNNIPLRIVDATSGSPVITDGIGIIAGAPNPGPAQRFVDYVGSAAVQAQLANDYNRMPTHPDALLDSPAWMGEFTYRVMDVDWGRLAEMQSEWIQYFEDEVRDSAKVTD